jgi:energy-coupling factor transporter ATP-binding protein EcfA2
MAKAVVERKVERREPVAGEAPPPAYFLSLTVENVRCFGPSQSLDLSDGAGRPARWTIILGDNGVGKTTLLQCLAALQSRLSGLRGKTHIDADSYTPYGMDALGLATGLLEGDRTLYINASIAYGAKLAADEHCRRIAFGYRGNPLVRSGPWTYEPIHGLICYGYGASRRMSHTAISEEPDLETCASLFADDVALLNAQEWLLWTDYTAKSTDGTRKIREEQKRDHIKELLLKVLPYDEVTDIKFVVPIDARPSVQFETPYGLVPIHSLSLGYKSIIAWMVDLASRLFDRYPNSENPLAEPAVVLVDEIDLHLHPRWQRKLIQHLTDLFPNTQFIATAHSPLVVQAATDANIVLLRREGDHVVIDNDPPTVAGWRVDQLLTSDLFGLPSARPPQLDGLLAERERILRKGKTTDADRRELKRIEAEIGELPTGDSPAEMEAMDIIRRAASLLKK